MLICRHIKADGHRCGSPAMTSKPYCFFHMKLYHMHKRDLPEIPPIEDSTSIFLAIGQVFRALHYETVDCKRAGLMLYALQTAFAVAKHREQAEPAETVCSVHNLEGDPLDFTEAARFGMDMLAPVDEVCDPPSACAGSNHSCEKPRASVDHDASAGRESSFDPDAPFTPESVAIIEAAIDDPALTTAERKKYVFAYVRYLKEQTAKNPPPENLSINAQADESSSINKKAPTIKTGRVPPSLRRLMLQGWETTIFPSHKNEAPLGWERTDSTQPTFHKFGCPMSPVVGDMGDETPDPQSPGGRSENSPG